MILKQESIDSNIIILYICAMLFLISPSSHATPEMQLPASSDIQSVYTWKKSISSIAHSKSMSVSLSSPEATLNIYQRNNFKPFWTYQISVEYWIKNLLTSLKQLGHDALPVQRYHLESFIHLLDQVENETFLLDVLITDALITAINDLSGEISHGLPSTGKNWRISPANTIDIYPLLEALTDGISPSTVLEYVRPKHDQYVQLRKAYIQKTRERADLSSLTNRIDEVKTDHNTTIDKNNRVNNMDGKEVNFQNFRGVELRRLENDISTIKINLQRWRTARGLFSDTYILVNTAAYELRLYDDSEPSLTMSVIVGKATRKTPSFSQMLTHVVLNPAWNIPPRIAREEILPKLKKNRDYARSRGIRAMDKNRPINWSEIPNTMINSENFPYRLQQVASDINPLGKYKFILPNSYMIFLHDTSNKTLFTKRKRSFSHGCVRLSEPHELAKHLLENNDLDADVIQQRVDSGKSSKIALKSPVAVIFMYLTAWVDENGDLSIYSDVYKQDKYRDI